MGDGAGPRFGERFEALHLLKEGLGVRTWRGRDTRAGGPVVVKEAPRALALQQGEALLQRELESLRAVQSPQVPTPLAAGLDEGTAWVALPFIEGETLRERMGEGPMGLVEALELAVSLLAALESVHAAGVLHGDLKPENLVLQGDGGVVLIDFGLSRWLQAPTAIQDVPVGTARYLPPERSGMLSRDLGEEADLYSAGVILHEALAGRPLFDGATVGEILRSHLASVPPGLRSLGVDVPGALDDLVLRLLEKEPHRRYGSAAGALADLREILEAVRSGAPPSSLALGRRDVRQALAEPGFVGRIQELGRLQEALASAVEGHGPLTLVSAPSGGGKTRLLQEFGQEVLRREGRLFTGRGRERQAPEPLQVLSEVAGEVLGAAARDSAYRLHLQEALAPWAPVLVTALPRLELVLGAGAQGDHGPELFAPWRIREALSAFLGALGRPGRPAVVVLDDLQWADDLTLAVLSSWVEGGGDPGRRHTTLVGALRIGEGPLASPLDALVRLGRSRQIRLDPLSEPQLRRLLASMAGPLPARVVDSVARLSEGNPFTAVEGLRGMVETGALVPGGQGWALLTEGELSLQTSRRAGVALSRRLEILPAEERHLLEAAAVVGREFDLELVASLAGLELAQARRIWRQVRRRRLLWGGRSGRHGLFAHDRIREALLEGIDAARRVTLHRRAGEYLEERGAPPYVLAYHLHQGGQPALALPYALSGAREARARFDLGLALAQYRIAAEVGDPASLREVQEGLGDVLMLQGRYAEAAQALEQAHQRVVDLLDQARLKGRLGELAFKQGEMEKAGALIEEALGLLGERVPGGRLAMLASLLLEVGVQIGHSLSPGRLGRGAEEAREKQLLAAFLFSRLSYTWWFNRPVEALLWVHLRHLNLAERFGPTPVLAQALSNHAVALTNLPWFPRSLAYAARGVEMRRALADRWGEGQALNFWGLALYAASRLPEALARFREAAAILRSTGDRWELNLARYHEGLCLYRQGQLQASAEVLRETWCQARLLGDPQASGISASMLACINHGELSPEELDSERERVRGDAQTTALVIQAQGIRLIGLGRFEEAAGRLQEAADLVERARKRNEYVATIPAWLATARRLALESTPGWDPARARRARGLAERAVAQALSWARAYRNNLPQALREAALMAAWRGRPGRARRLLQESLAAAEAAGMEWEQALTWEQVGRLGAAAGWPEAEGSPARSREVQRRLGVWLGADGVLPRFLPPPTPALEFLSPADRLTSILEEGSRVVAASSREGVLRALRQAALRALRAQECAILEVGLGGGAEPGFPVVGALVERALDIGRPACLSEGGAAPSDSMVDGFGSSILCAPLPVEGQVRRLLYAVHHQLPDLFGEEEEEVAAFLVALATSALENLAAHERDLVEQRELHRQELRLERLEARRSALARFLGVASHDLRNLWAVVGLYARQLQPGISAERLEASRAAMLLTCQRGERLVEGYLDASRVEAGRTLELEREPCQLSRVVLEELEFHQALRTVEDGAPTRVEVQLEELEAWLDVERIRQAVSNLVGNAMKFNRPGGRIRLAVLGRGGEVRFEVQDEGPGIAPADRARLFEPFASLLDRRSGPGLGLWICRIVVEAHGGRAGLEGAPGEGSTFWFQVPRGA